MDKLNIETRKCLIYITELYCLIILGEKMLPEANSKHEKNWAFVDRVKKNKRNLLNKLGEHFYIMKTRGWRFLPKIRPVVEYVYGIGTDSVFMRLLTLLTYAYT